MLFDTIAILALKFEFFFKYFGNLFFCDLEDNWNYSFQFDDIFEYILG